MHRAASWITCCGRLWAHTNRFEQENETYKRIQTDLAYGQTVDAERNVSFIEIDKAQDVFNFQKNEVS